MQPIVELFLVVGSLEIVCRAWEGRTDLAYPKALIAAALLVVLAANVTDHVLRAAQRAAGPGPCSSWSAPWPPSYPPPNSAAST